MMCVLYLSQLMFTFVCKLYVVFVYKLMGTCVYMCIYIYGCMWACIEYMYYDYLNAHVHV